MDYIQTKIDEYRRQAEKLQAKIVLLEEILRDIQQTETDPRPQQATQQIASRPKVKPFGKQPSPQSIKMRYCH